MQEVEDFVGALRARYGGQVPFKEICEDEGITVMTAPLGYESRGFYYSRDETKLIVVNETLPDQEAKEWAMHLLWHHFYRYRCGLRNPTVDEMRAYLFVALAMADQVHPYENAHSLAKRYGITIHLAIFRVGYALGVDVCVGGGVGEQSLPA